MNKQVEVTLKNKLGNFTIVLTPNRFDSWDLLGYRGLVELQKLNKPVSKYDTVSMKIIE